MKLSLPERLARQVSLRIPLARRSLELHRGVLSITFDDVPKTAWTEGGAVLAAHGVKATYFACGGLCGRTFDGQPICDVPELEAVYAAGHEIGCHTHEHLSAHRSSPADYAASCERNRRFLEDRLPGLRLRSFAYPYGHAPLRHRWRVARRFAACRGVATRRGRKLNGPMVDPSLLPAVGLTQDGLRHDDIAAHVAEAAARRAWLVLFTHDVRDQPSAHGCTPGELDSAIRLAREAGLDILPFGEVLSAGARPSP
jgi:peptidoglycan/xylan/chitin deacetylase (PgdA/CDA1 family)